MKALSTCPHCGALLGEDPLCTICGKSPHDEVQLIEAAPPPSRWESMDRRRAMITTARVVAGLVVVGGLWFWATRPGPVYVADELPTPASTTSIKTTDARAPSVDHSAARSAVSAATPDPATADPDPVDVDVSAGRPTPAGTAPPGTTLVDPAPTGADAARLAPWEEAPPTDLLSGEWLEPADLEVGRARVAELIEAIPAPWQAAPPATTTVTVGSRVVDLAEAETSQPFAARSISHRNGTVVGDVWLVATVDGDPDGSDYVARATARWAAGPVVETAPTGPGVRLVRRELVGSTSWHTDLSSPSVLIVRPADGVDTALIAAFVEDWHRAVVAAAVVERQARAD